jgi:hypothetical protein
MRFGEGWGFPHYTRWVSQEKKKTLKRVGVLKIPAGRILFALYAPRLYPNALKKIS